MSRIISVIKACDHANGPQNQLDSNSHLDVSEHTCYTSVSGLYQRRSVPFVLTTPAHPWTPRCAPHKTPKWNTTEQNGTYGTKRTNCLIYADNVRKAVAKCFPETHDPVEHMRQTLNEAVQVAVTSPLTAIATDGYLKNGKGHPRTAGTYSLILGRFVREQRSLSLMDALNKMSLMPAQRLESRVPSLKNKGRIAIGADADLAIFDPDQIIDTSTYEEPTLPPEGMLYVVVNGIPVVENGKLQEGTTPGREVRAPVD